jgi:hypothetical protein
MHCGISSRTQRPEVHPISFITAVAAAVNTAAAAGGAGSSAGTSTAAKGTSRLQGLLQALSC